jgi:hypothetical protein
MSDRLWLLGFIRESNMIEGIIRRPAKGEIAAHEKILALGNLGLDDLVEFVAAVAPHARLRDQRGLNVCVGAHLAPAGGDDIPINLAALLANLPYQTPYKAHCRYEKLHPFTDGNGRSGRALWLWQVLNGDNPGEAERAQELGFLHCFYYQTLAASDTA